MKNELNDVFSKAGTLLDYPPHLGFFQMTVGARIDRFSKEISRTLGNSPSIADGIFEIDENLRVLPMTFSNGDPKAISVKIRFRTLQSDDANTNETLAPFANYYSDFITSYNTYMQNLNEPLIWRPGFTNKTRTLDFNRFLSVPKASVSNDKVILLNTQIRNDKWEVVFATDEKTDQKFTFDIVYDDGYVSLTKTFEGEVVMRNQEIKEFTAILGAEGSSYGSSLHVATQEVMTVSMATNRKEDVDIVFCYDPSSSTVNSSDFRFNSPDNPTTWWSEKANNAFGSFIAENSGTRTDFIGFMDFSSTIEYDNVTVEQLKSVTFYENKISSLFVDQGYPAQYSFIFKTADGVIGIIEPINHDYNIYPPEQRTITIKCKYIQL